MINTYDYSISHPDSFKQLAVKDLLFLHYICPQIEKYLYLYTHFNQISFTLGGDKSFHHNNKTWQMSASKALFARKTAWKQEIGTSGWEILSFYMPDAYLKNFFRGHREQLPVQRLPPPSADMMIEIAVNDTTRAFFYGMLPYFTQQPPPSEHLLELKFRELLFNILSNPANSAMLSYLNSLSDLRKPPLQEIMEANFYFNLSINDFARLAQRSPGTFKRDFIKIYQIPPGKWLAEKRIQHARHLLCTCSRNISEIAYDSGFENVTHFGRVFKEKFGMAPLQYRKQLQLGNAL